MSWLEDQIAKSEEVRTVNALLDNHGAAVFADVWEALLRIIEEARSKLTDFRFSSKGSPKEHTVKADPNKPQLKPRQMTLGLELSKRLIVAFVAEGSIPFEIGVCSDGVVCLKHGVNPISSQDAAQMILGPFLFPELYPPPSSSPRETRKTTVIPVGWT
jgi:hypothetical protein